jgi:type IV secretion system protein VirB3
VASIERDRVFVALTRPQMFVANAVGATEGFLIFKSPWVLAFALLVHAVGAALCLREPRFFDLWLTRVRRCPRVANFSIWRCNSYRP